MEWVPVHRVFSLMLCLEQPCIPPKAAWGTRAVFVNSYWHVLTQWYGFWGTVWLEWHTLALQTGEQVRGNGVGNHSLAEQGNMQSSHVLSPFFIV